MQVAQALRHADTNTNEKGETMGGIVAVTGAAGAVGSEAATILGAAGWTVIGIDLGEVKADGLAMALGGVVPDVRPQDRLLGLGLVPGLALLPDVDGLGSSIPHAVLAPLAEADEDVTVVGLDTDTALVGSGPADDGRWEFRALGRGSAWVIAPERRRRVLAPLRLAVRA